MASPQNMCILAAGFILIQALTKRKVKKTKRNKRWWIREIYRNRDQSNRNLMVDLIFEGDEAPFKNFTRMSKKDFKLLLSLVEPKIRKQDTTFRKAILPADKLILTLRFLATGDSYASLQYLFKISKQSISALIPDVCKAIIDSLKKHCQVSCKIFICLVK